MTTSNAASSIHRAALVTACLLASCDSCTPAPPPAPTPVVDAAVQPIEPEPEPPPAPLPVPAAYFGDLPALERVSEPIGTEPIERGNVLLVVIDTLNAKHVGAYGYQRPTTPNLDALARQGLVLTNHLSNCSWTRPAMATILTGLPKKQHLIELHSPPIADEINTLAERFAAAGYRTAGVVGNPLVRDKWGYGQGFQTYVDAVVLNHFKMADDALITDRAIAWLEQHGDQPFFLFVFLTAPHHPYEPAAGFRRFFEGLPQGQVVEIPLREYPQGMDPGDRAHTVAAYDGEVLYADHHLGRLIAHLRDKGLLGQTTVAITADHGEAFGEHNCFQHTYHQWEPVLRVPFVLSSPALPAKGLFEDRPFNHLDIAPTLLDLAGVDHGQPALPGTSLVRALADPRRFRDRELFAQYNAHGIRRQTARKGRFKLVHHHPVDRAIVKSLMKFSTSRRTPPTPDELPTVAWDTERYELFDLLADPGENTNLFADRKTAPATAELMAYILGTLDDDRQLTVEIDDELRQALEAVGYIAAPADGR
jgi:arylsulfatase A-like enzyme